ncbi:hypothetical protein C8Q76DRAFT_803422 [Earliella scabrosa]|nr:hypothetical protein C8Q76DRAFT_803422 [Earliella scabrosa]
MLASILPERAKRKHANRDYHTAILKKIASRTFKVELLAATQEVSITVQDIRTALSKAHEDIGRHNRLTLIGADGEPERSSMETRLERISEGFKQALKANRIIAIEAAAFLKQFAATILSQNPRASDIPGLRIEMNIFLEILAVKQRKAQETRDLLEALSEKVEELAMEVEQAAIGDTAGCDTPKLSEVHRRVDDIHERLKRKKSEIVKVGARCLLYAVAGTGAVGIVVFALLPAAMTLVLSSFTTAIGHGLEMGSLMKEHRGEHVKSTLCDKPMSSERWLLDIKDELKEVMHNSYERWGVHNECIRNLDKAWSDVRYLTTRVNPILELWSRLHADILELEHHLEPAKAESSEGARPFVSVSRFKVTRALYETLATLLEAHAVEFKPA